ncbi:MAG: hypothetical protein NTV34_07235 [Proteobacteria bacterium]|nr:hypothetical protein [Pseudomonadota bacterium]
MSFPTINLILALSLVAGCSAKRESTTGSKLNSVAEIEKNLIEAGEHSSFYQSLLQSQGRATMRAVGFDLRAMNDFCIRNNFTVQSGRSIFREDSPPTIDPTSPTGMGPSKGRLIINLSRLVGEEWWSGIGRLVVSYEAHNGSPTRENPQNTYSIKDVVFESPFIELADSSGNLTIDSEVPLVIKPIEGLGDHQYLFNVLLNSDSPLNYRLVLLNDALLKYHFAAVSIISDQKPKPQVSGGTRAGLSPASGKLVIRVKSYPNYGWTIEGGHFNWTADLSISYTYEASQGRYAVDAVELRSVEASLNAPPVDF